MATKPEVIETFLKKLPQLLPSLPVFRIEQQVRIRRKGPMCDLVLEVRVGGKARQLLCEVKSVGEPRYILQAIATLDLLLKGAKGAYPLIIAPYISPEGQRICRNAKVGFIDLTGNAFLRFDNVLIEKTSKEVPRQARARLRHLFSPRASRVLRAFLEDSKREWTLLHLSREARVSLRTAYLVVNGLQEKAFVEKKRGAIALLKPGELLDLWAQNYTVDLNQKQTYYTFDRSTWKFLEKLAAFARRRRDRYALTLHSGASLVAPFVRFTDIHFYFTGELEDLVQALDLRPVETGGTIHILVPYDEGIFYRLQEIQGLQVVCNTQLYLDLINYPARGKEQADFLRRQKIAF